VLDTEGIDEEGKEAISNAMKMQFTKEYDMDNVMKDLFLNISKKVWSTEEDMSKKPLFANACTLGSKA